MNQTLKSNVPNYIQVWINASNLSSTKRHAALEALSSADMIVDAIMWVARKIDAVRGPVFLKPSAKH